MGKIIIVSNEEFEKMKRKKHAEVAGFTRDINPHPRDVRKWIKDKNKKGNNDED